MPLRLNTASFIGRLVRDAKLFEYPSHSKIVFTLAVPRGGETDECDFPTFALWDRAALHPHLTQGTEILIHDAKFRTHRFKQNGEWVNRDYFLATRLELGAKPKGATEPPSGELAGGEEPSDLTPEDLDGVGHDEVSDLE